MPRDEDDDSRPERIKRAYRCKDRTRGAEDCASCHPTTYDRALCEDETEDEAEDANNEE